MGKIRHEQIADDGSQIKSHRTNKSEFRINHKGLLFTCHNTSSMKVSMNQSLGFSHELSLHFSD